MKQLHALGASVIASIFAVTGAVGQTQVSVAKPVIVVGQSLPLTGPGSLIAQPFRQGAKLYFDRVNAQGGVQGRKIELVTLDDLGSAANTAANTKKLVSQGVLSLFGYYGTAQVEAAYSVIKGSDVLIVAPMAAADDLHGSAYPNLYLLRPGYSEEIAALVHHAITLGARKFAVLHFSDSESQAALDSASRVMPTAGATILVKVPLQTGGISNSVDKALEAKPEAVLIISDAARAAATVKDLNAKGYRGPIYGTSNTGESLLAEELGASGSAVVVARVVPRSDDTKLLLARELLADAAAAKLGNPNVFMMQGYLAARVYTEALRRMQEPTRQALKKSLDNLENFNVGGFRVHFAGQRVGSRMVELGLVDTQGRVRQ